MKFFSEFFLIAEEIFLGSRGNNPGNLFVYFSLDTCFLEVKFTEMKCLLECFFLE